METLFILMAAGHNNQDNLKPFHLFQEPYFSLYSVGILHEFYDCDSRVRGGDRRWKPQGLPSAKANIPLINNFEITYLRHTFCDDMDDGEVTVQMLNPKLMLPQVFNATFSLPELRGQYQAGWDYCEWRDYPLEWIDMVVLDVRSV